jgi:hypothetical protein
MIIDCGSVRIDTEEDHEAHKNAVRGKSDSGMLCSRSSPKQFFTQLVDGYTRFYDLHYNKDGSKLKKIEYWDKKKDSERKKKYIKEPKNADNCYFSKQLKGDEEYVIREELDFWDIAHPHVTVWRRHWWN